MIGATFHSSGLFSQQGTEKAVHKGPSGATADPNTYIRPRTTAAINFPLRLRSCSLRRERSTITAETAGVTDNFLVSLKNFHPSILRYLSMRHLYLALRYLNLLDGSIQR